jgi:hypothetical protein
MTSKQPATTPGIPDTDLPVIWAALWAMVEDNHAPQDGLSGDQWERAERLLAELDARMNAMAEGSTADER